MKKRILSIITALALCLSLCPTWALAAEADPSLCKHHPAHTEDCGYTAPTEGQPCGHQHTAECYTMGVLTDADGGDYYEIGADTENLLDCQHSHDSACGYVQADPGTPCGFACAECEKAGTQKEGNTAVPSVQAMIDTLPSVEEVKSLSLDGQREVYVRLQRACDAYEALSGEEQGQIDGAEILEELFCWFNSQIASAATEIDSGDFSDDLHWRLYDDGTLNITGSGTMPNYGGWVNSKDKIKKVVVGNGIASVGYMAFEGCTNLTEIDLPDSITSIDNRAFYGCTNLATIKWPNNLTSIGNLAFKNCTSLALTELPNSVTFIDIAAFSGCTGLALTKLPDGLTRIERSTFESCTNLALTELPSGITSIGNSAFNRCTNLALEELPDGVQSIGEAAFYLCPNLALTKLPSGLTSIEKNTFWSCTNLALTELSDSITSIGNGAFYGCTDLTLTKLPDNLTSIGASAFYKCSNLALTELPVGVTSIGNDAFNQCASLALTRLPDQVTSIGSYAFCQCTSLVQIEVPTGVTSIGNSAFRMCTNLTEMTFTNSTPPALGTDAFLNCPALKAIYVPTGATNYTQANNWPEEKIKILAAPSFTTQPQNAEVTVGQAAVFSVDVSGEPASTCQWQVKKGGDSWENILGATDNSYTTAQTDMSMDGWQYRCVATNDLGTTESSAATLTVTPLDLSGASVRVSGTYIYTGEVIQPVNVTVELGNKQLTQGTDYTVRYSNNVSVGTDTAKVIITGQGNYTGTAEGTFTIGKANSSITTVPTASGITYGQALSDSNLTDGAGSVAGAFAWKDGTVKPSAGTAQHEVIFTPTDTTNYNTATVNVSVTVDKATPTIVWGSAAQTFTYTGQPAQITAPTVTLVNSETFSGTISYSYTGTSSGTGVPVNAGTYTVKASIPAQGNYTAAESTNTLTLTIKQAKVTITWNPSMQTTTYTGQTAKITAPTVSAEGGVAVSMTPKYSYAVPDSNEFTDGLPVNAGAYTVKASIADSGNLTAAEEDMTLTIEPAAITVTPNNGQHKEYGAADPALAYQITSGQLFGTDTLTGGLAYSGVNVGEYEITQGTLAATANYSLTVTPGVMFEITKPSLDHASISLSETSFTYDGTPKKPTVTVEKAGSNVDAGEYEISFSDNTNAGTVTVTVTAKESGNYAGSCSAAFTIEPKELTPAITGATIKTYDGTTAAPDGLSITLTGVVQGDNVTATVAGYAYDNANAGVNKTITATGIALSGNDAENYTLSETTAATTGTITKAAVSITWGNPTQTATYSGTQVTITPPVVSAENGVTVSVTPGYSYAAQDSNEFTDGLPVNAGTYTVRASIAESGNLTAAQADMVLTINKADGSVSITGDPGKTYDGAAVSVPAYTKSSTGAVTVEYKEQGAEDSAYNTAAPSNAGSYTVRITADADTNYTSASSTRDFTVTARTAEIDWSGTSLTYTGSEQKPAATVANKVGNDDVTVTVTGGQTNAGGPYTATAEALTGAAAGNYQMPANKPTASFTISKAKPTVTGVSVSSPATIYESAALSSITLTHDSDDTPGEVTLDAGQTLTVGTKDYNWTFHPADTVNYDAVKGTVSLTVEADTLQSIVITAAPDKTTYTYGERFDKTGMVITAEYASGAVEAVTDKVEISPATLTVDTTVLTISYQGKTVSQAVTVNPKTVSASVTVEPDSYVYTGEAITPAKVEVKDGDTVISPSEYTVEYGNNTNVGTAVVQIIDRDGGNYVVSGGGSFTITAKSLAGATVDVPGTFTYSGNAHTPEPVVTLGGRTLAKDTDYTVSYSGNVNAGTAFVAITGQGNYSGTASGTFTIGKAVLTVDGTGIAKGTYGNTLSALTVEGLTARLNDTVVNGTWALTGETVPNVGDSGEYTAIFTPSSGAVNYNELTAPVTLDISKADYTGTRNVSTSGRYGKTRTYELADLLPDGYVLGTVTITDSHGIFEGTPAVNGTTLTYGLADNRDNVDETGTIIVPVTSSTNYNAFDLTIVVTVTNVQVPDLNVNPIQVIYTGTPVPDSSISGTATVDGISIDGTWSFVEGQDITNAADSGTKEVKFTPRDTNLYSANTGTVTVTIRKATPSLTLTPSPAMLPSGGAVTLTLTGLPEGGPAVVTCSDENISVTEGSGNTWTAELPAGGASYIFTAAYAGDSNHNSASANCTVSVEKITPDLSLTATPNSLRGGGTVTLTLTGLPAGGTAAVTCSGDITVTAGAGSTWTATLPNSTAIYAFTADFAGSDSHNSASASCNVSVTAVTALPNPPAAEDGRQYQVVMEDGISEVPAGLQSIETLDTPAKLESAMRTAITQANSSVPQDSAAVYDVELQVSTDGGATWTKASAENFPANGLTVTLPYPAGTDSSYTFTVVHMFTTGDFGKTPGDTETPQVSNTASGLQFTVTGLSPISVGWVQSSTPVTPSTPSGGGGSGGSSSKPAITSEPEDTQNVCDGGADCPSHGFTDLGGAEAWYHEAVDFVLRNGLMSGYTSTLFGPDENLSRAQLAQILYNKEGKPSVTGNDVFTDVDNGAWYAPAITWAAGSGIVGGYGDGTFGPNDNITREQLAVMLWRYAGNPAATDKELHFTDAGKVSRYAAEALRWAIENGIINGKGGGILDPQGLATRAQTAQMLMNFMGK